MLSGLNGRECKAGFLFGLRVGFEFVIIFSFGSVCFTLVGTTWWAVAIGGWLGGDSRWMFGSRAD